MKPSRGVRCFPVSGHVSGHLSGLLCALLALAVGLFASACEKHNDLPRLQDEALATAKVFQQRLDELSHRAAAIGPRVSQLPSDLPDANKARQLHQQALSTIEERRRDLQSLPQGVQASLKAGSPDELMRLIDHTRETQERSATEASSQLSAVESWVALAEQRQTAPGAPAAASAHEADDRPQGSQAPAH